MVCVCCVQGSEVTVSFSPAGGVMLNEGTAVTRRVGRVYVLDRVLIAPQHIAPHTASPQPGERDTGFGNTVNVMLQTLETWWSGLGL